MHKDLTDLWGKEFFEECFSDALQFMEKKMNCGWVPGPNAYYQAVLAIAIGKILRKEGK